MTATGTAPGTLALARSAWAWLAEAREDLSHDDIRRVIGDALASLGEDENGWRAWAREVFDDRVVYEWGGKLWQAPYTVTDEGASLGDSVEVRVTYTPADATAEALVRRAATPEREALVKALDESPTFRDEVRALVERFDGPTLVDLVEAEIVPLAERAVAADGTALIKLIQPGWGSTGHYSREVLERDLPRAFPAGTKMYWNHPTDREARERPEGDLDLLAGELLEAPAFREGGPQGAGAYARAKVFGRFREAVDELASHIGVSIRGRGRTKAGTVEGRTGPIVDEIVEGVSVDFVTLPGAGGAVVEMFEAAGRRPGSNPTEGEGTGMDQLEEARRRAEEAEAKLAEAATDRDTWKERAERAELGLAVSGAAKVIAEAMADVKIPDAAKARIAERLEANPPIDDDGKLDAAKLTETAKADAEAERAYLASIAGSGRVVGLGESDDPTSAERDEAEGKALDEAYGSLARTMGLGEKVAETFVRGR